MATIVPRDGRSRTTARAELVLARAECRTSRARLEAAGVETTKTGIAVDERLRTSAPGSGPRAT